MRKKKLLYNTIISFTNQIITIICGFILPRAFLNTYGSEVNGLVSSITQFLGVIAFMQLGVGAVVQSSLYKPLSDKNNDEISKIYISAQKFFRIIASIFLIYTIILTIIYPNIINNSFNFSFTASLILIISFSSFAQYFFGLTNQLLLNADQKSYIPLIIDGVTLIGNTIFSVLLMKYKVSIQAVKLSTTLIYLLRPILMNIYVKKKYIINKKVSINEEPIKQKWNGFTQHLASSVMDNTDIIILTIFATLKDVSIYYIYHMVVNGVRQLITSLTTGIQSFFGNVIAQNESQNLKTKFNYLELLIHVAITYLFTCTLILIVPFVSVYTNGINDVNYNTPLFAVILTFSQAIYCYRLIYYVIIKAAGHYRQTQNSAIIEMSINIIISIILVIKYGLIGVAIGTLIANLYRLIYFIIYLSKKILHLNIKTTAFRLAGDIISIIICYVSTLKMVVLVDYTYKSWIIMGVKVAITSLFIIITINCLFNLKILRKVFKKILLKIKKRNNNTMKM